MTVQEAYYHTLNICNKLVSNTEQVIPKHIFVQVFNEEQLHWADNCYKVEEKTKSEIHKIQQLLVSDKKIKTSKKSDLFSIFDFPKNYFKYSSSYSKINQCPYILENHLKESHNKASLIKDPMWQPSTKFEETILFISEDRFHVLRSADIIPEELILSYYRLPKPINMADGFDDFDGVKTKDIHPEWTGSNILEIIDLTAARIASNYGDMLKATSETTHIQQTQIRL